MRIILYFGSFNPLHNGHINAAVNAMKTIGAYKVIFIPSYLSFENKKATSYFINAIDRYNMIKEAIKNINGFEVCDYEINQQRKVYTIETLKYLANKYYRDNIYILIGGDQLKDFFNWKNASEILKIASIICYRREGYHINEADYNSNDFLFLNQNQNAVSSTWIRENKVVNFLPKSVLNYINNNGLYLDLRISSYISPKRFQHSLRVAIMAYEIMQIYDPKNAMKAWVAGAYHDIFKELGEIQTKRMMNNYQLNTKLSWKVMHGPIAKEFLEKIYHFNDSMILNAIANHTIPDLNSKLTILDKVLFCCDKLEPKRTNDDVNNIEHYRSLLKKDLDKCFDELYAYQKQLFTKKTNSNDQSFQESKLTSKDKKHKEQKETKETNNSTPTDKPKDKELKQESDNKINKVIKSENNNQTKQIKNLKQDDDHKINNLVTDKKNKKKYTTSNLEKTNIKKEKQKEEIKEDNKNNASINQDKQIISNKTKNKKTNHQKDIDKITSEVSHTNSDKESKQEKDSLTIVNKKEDLKVKKQTKAKKQKIKQPE